MHGPDTRVDGHERAIAQTGEAADNLETPVAVG